MKSKSTNSISNPIYGTDIVSSDVHQISVDQQFVEQYGLDDFDMEILKNAVHVNTGMTDYQSRHFVAGSQLTPWRKVRQALMELEVRYHAYFEIRNSLRKAEVLREMFIRDIENEPDDLKQKLLQIDMDKNDYDITIWKRKLRQSEIEINSFLTIIRESAETPEDLEYFVQPNEDEERQYWVYRMAKQAAMDIIAFGRVGSGNMDSIAMMDREDQLEVLRNAVRYAGLININIAQLGDEAAQEAQEMLDSGRMGIPTIEDGSVQRTIEPKTIGERISFSS